MSERDRQKARALLLTLASLGPELYCLRCLESEHDCECPSPDTP